MVGSDACFSRTYGSLTERSRFRDTDFQADFRSLGSGAHRARLSCFDCGEMRILSVHDRGGIQMRGAVNDDALVAVFMWGQDTQVNGLRQDVPHLLLLGPGTELTATQPGEYRYLRMGLRGTALGRLAERPTSVRSVQPWLRRGVFKPRCSAAAEWRLQRSLLRALRLGEPATPPTTRPGSATTVAAANVVQDLLATLGTIDGSGAREPAPAASRRRLVGRALDSCMRPPTSRCRSPRSATPSASPSGHCSAPSRTVWAWACEPTSASGGCVGCMARSSPKATDGRSPTSR